MVFRHFQMKSICRVNGGTYCSRQFVSRANASTDISKCAIEKLRSSVGLSIFQGFWQHTCSTPSCSAYTIAPIPDLEIPTAKSETITFATF